MGQKRNPIGNRLGLIRGWESNWYGGNNFGDKLAEDAKIRKYLKIRLAKASVSRIAIERTLKIVTVTTFDVRLISILARHALFNLIFTYFLIWISSVNP